MSTATTCDYPDCGQPATYRVQNIPVIRRPFHYGGSRDACDEHVQLVHTWPSGFIGWALLPVTEEAA